MGMAEPRRVAFISLSPVRRREAEYPSAEREPEYPREPPWLEPQPYREPARAEQPAPREAAPRSDAQPPPREKPLPQREVSRAEPPMSLQREPPRPEPPPPPLPQLHLQPPPPRESASRAEPQQRPPRETVRLELVLKDPTDESCVEFSYPELLLCGEQRVQKILPFSPRPRSPSDPSVFPSALHLQTPTWRVSDRPEGAGAERVDACLVLFSFAPPLWPGSHPVPPTPFVRPLQTLLRAGFPRHLSKPQIFFLFFLRPIQNLGALQVALLGLPCGAPAVVPVERKRKGLGDTPPSLKARDCITPSSIILSFITTSYALR